MTHDFKWRHFRGEVILWAVRWYCRYGVSYRDLEEMLEERGVAVHHTTICTCGANILITRLSSFSGAG